VMKYYKLIIKNFDQVKNDNFDQVKFDQVIVCLLKLSLAKLIFHIPFVRQKKAA
jgi:hypothetical protein